MATLLELSEIRAALPQFAGANLTERLIAGHAQARRRLLKYTTVLKFKPSVAESLATEIGAWQDRNVELLKSYMDDPNLDTLPEQVAFQFGPEKAQAFVVAGFSEATRGLGPWVSGDIARRVATDPRTPEPWVREDAQRRLDVFASIVKMDDDGDLEKIFHPEQSAPPQQQQLGFLPAVVAAVGAKWLIVALILTVLATVALFLLYRYSMEKLRLNNRIMADLCKEAQKRGDTAVVEKCVEKVAEASSGPDWDKYITLAIAGVVLYGVTVTVLPILTKKAVTGT